MAAKKSAAPKSKQPRKYPSAKPGEHTMMPDDVIVLKDGETRGRPDEKKSSR
jgi:hypothetical protein